MLDDFLKLAREQGPATASWLLLFGAVVWFSGQGAKAAVSNVQSLLAMNAQLRQELADQLAKANDGRNEAEQANARLRVELADANRRMQTLQGRLEHAEHRATRLEAEMEELRLENAQLRNAKA